MAGVGSVFIMRHVEVLLMGYIEREVLIELLLPRLSLGRLLA